MNGGDVRAAAAQQMYPNMVAAYAQDAAAQSAAAAAAAFAFNSQAALNRGANPQTAVPEWTGNPPTAPAYVLPYDAHVNAALFSNTHRY